MCVGRLKPSAPCEIPAGHRRVERVSISDFGSQSDPPTFEAIVFGIRLSIGTVGEQADNLEATRRAAAYQDCHGHCGVGVCRTLTSADMMAITKCRIVPGPADLFRGRK